MNIYDCIDICCHFYYYIFALTQYLPMNIRIKNRRNLEFDLADLEIMIKDYIEE